MYEHLLTTALTGTFAQAESGGIAALGISPQGLILQAITFLILFALLKKFAFTKIIELLEERRKAIDDGIRLGREMEAEKAKLDEQVNESLRAARKESDGILSDAHREAGDIIKVAEDAAEKKVAGMLDDARAKIDQDMKRAHDNLRREVLGLVAEATEAVIDEKLDPSKDARLVEKAVAGARR